MTTIKRAQDADLPFHLLARYSLFYDVDNFPAALEKATELYHAGKLPGILKIGYFHEIRKIDFKVGSPLLFFVSLEQTEMDLMKLGLMLKKQLMHKRQKCNSTHPGTNC